MGPPGEDMAVSKGRGINCTVWLGALECGRRWGKGGLELALVLQASAPLQTSKFSGRWKKIL